MRFLDHILGASYDQNRHRQASQIGRLDMRLVDHQAKHLGVLFCLLGFLGEETCYVVTQFDRPLIKRLHAAWKQVSSIQNHFFDPHGILQSKFQCNIAPIGEAKKNGFLDTFFIHEVV